MLEQAYFFCSSYRKNSDVCSAHYIREKVVAKAILESMQRVFWYVQCFEKDFARKQMAAFGEGKKKELSEKRREFAQAEKQVYIVAYQDISVFRATSLQNAIQTLFF